MLSLNIQDVMHDSQREAKGRRWVSCWVSGGTAAAGGTSAEAPTWRLWSTLELTPQQNTQMQQTEWPKAEINTHTWIKMAVLKWCHDGEFHRLCRERGDFTSEPLTGSSCWVCICWSKSTCRAAILFLFLFLVLQLILTVSALHVKRSNPGWYSTPHHFCSFHKPPPGPEKTQVQVQVQCCFVGVLRHDAVVSFTERKAHFLCFLKHATSSEL